jgi:ATP-dependent Clp protease ATP-binding subunit ClpC
MFERFIDRARRVVDLARHEARTLGHDHIGTEHILLGLIDEGAGVAITALTSMGINLDEMRQAVQDSIGRGAKPSAESGHIPFTPRAKKVLELSLREANQLGHNYIGTEHILLGLIREGGGAAQLLAGAGVDYDRARQQVIELLYGHREAGLATAPPPAAPGRGRAHGPADLDRHAAERHRAAAQAVSPGMTAHSRRLSPRCQSVPTSAKPAALNASTWVASSVDSDSW